ncbi:MAG: LCP family protein [Roseiflexaceae bacterium]|nr:LCP family protein [Roseiflexaceae bacterium]
MSDERRRDPAPRAYTDETIVVPRRPPQPGVAPRRRATPRRRIWPIVRNTLLGLLTGAVLLAGLAYWQVSTIAAAITTRDVRPAAFGLGAGSNILIIGTDERVGFPAEGVRGDTLVVAHYDTLGRWVNLLSIPRDTQVGLPDIGETKINVAYGQGYGRAEELYGAGTSPQQGGMALAAQTVEGLLKLRDRGQGVDHIAVINFDGFARIIDALGGVTIDVPRYILDTEYPTEDFGITTVEFQPGLQRMNGETALIYARTRHDSSDFERGARQQQVMRAIVEQARSQGPLGLLIAAPQLREGLEGAVATTLPFARPDQLLGLLWLAGGLNPNEIGQVRLGPEIDPLFQEIGSNLIWSEAGIGAAVDGLLARPTPASVADEQARVQVLNGTDTAGLANKISFELEDQGFTVLTPGNALANAERTLIYDRTGKPQTARALASALGAAVQQGSPEGLDTEADIVVILGADAVE